jgi:excisionase family DNA binding protein
MELGDLKTEHEAAGILGLSVRTLQWRRSHGSNDLPYVKMGRSVRYRSEDLRAYIEKNIVDLTTGANQREDAAR